MLKSKSALTISNVQHADDMELSPSNFENQSNIKKEP